MTTSLIHFFRELFVKMHFSESASTTISNLICFIILIAISIGLYFLLKLIANKVIIRLIRRTKFKGDDILIKNRVLKYICLVIPVYLIRVLTPSVLPDVPKLANFIIHLSEVYEIIMFIMIINACLNSVNDLYNTVESLKTKSIKGLIQVFKIIVTCIGILLIIANITHKELGNIFIGLGTASAVLMLVFRDTILGFVGGIQLTINDMVRIGDWIEMSKNNADGNVIDITLTTVKVQNWDNTITTIPTYSLVSESFTNWRGMSESLGRRIKRSINIEVDTVKFCTPEMLERFKNFELVKQYIIDTENNINKFNLDNHVDTSSLVNGRRQTNIGVFRAYLMEYLKSNPYICKDETLIVRQLQPGDSGIPIEIYGFSIDKSFENYEKIQSDIFDHIYAVVPMFDLKIFQKPSSATIKSIDLSKQE